MDEKDVEFFKLLNKPNCGSHVKMDFDNSIQKIIFEVIYNSVKSISKSIIDAALIISDKEYAKSVIEKRNNDERKKKEEKKSMDEKNRKIYDSYTNFLMEEIKKINDLTHEEKIDAYNLILSSDPSALLNSVMRKFDPYPIVKSAVVKSIEKVDELRSNILKMLDNKINVLTYSMLGLNDVFSSVTMMILVQNDEVKTNEVTADSMLMTMLMRDVEPDPKD